MSGPNLTERVTLQQENITCSSQSSYDVRTSKIGIFMLIYIYDMEYETVIIDLSLYITFKPSATLAAMGAWPKYKHINNWVVNLKNIYGNLFKERKPLACILIFV